MSNLLLRIAIALGLLVGIVALIGSLLPRDYAFESRVEVAAPPEDVFPWLNNLDQWQNWSMWRRDRIEGLSVQTGPKKEGVGAVQTWSEPRGRGKLWITASEPDRRVEYKLDFENFPTMDSTIQLVPSGQGTTVIWTSRGKLPSGPFYGYFGSIFGDGMKYEYDQALQELKKQIESIERR